MDYQVEHYPVTVFKELNDLLQDHKDEVCVFPGVQLIPDWDTYAKLSDSGNLCVVTAKEDGVIVGYTINVISRHLHYPFLMAVNDIIYFKPEYRGHGLTLIRRTQQEVKLKGARFFSISVKPHIDFRPVLERMGYELLEYQYFRRL
jgi:hypothetical protein